MSVQFDEEYYRAWYPDVAAAIAAGYFASGQDHYTQFGIHEGRQPCMPRRVEKALSVIDKSGLGLEIGPSYNPLAPRKLGYNVHILDHLNASQLREKYANGAQDIRNIEEVDFVWKGEKFADLIGNKSCYDWIVASNVIEHVPDFIGFLQQCRGLLKPSGVLSLVIPDKRYCFDYFSQLDLTDSFLDAFYEQRTKPTPGQVFSYFSNYTIRDSFVAWHPGYTGDIKLRYTFDYAKEMCDKAISHDDYIDVHCWRFIPESFRLIISDLNKLGLLGMSIVKEFDTEGFEFHVTLGKGAPESAENRLQMLAQIADAPR